ncbi:hypothetical protein CesoFtcFv8_000056 [Champsocephalus esox]|nr:hypothetical protein CesoFtcFv8_000056 [Champsocephalus esox]
MTSTPGNGLKKKQPMKPAELILILIHGQKVNTMTLSWMRTIGLRKMIVMQTRLNIVKKRLHLKLSLLNVISVQGHICGSDR